MRVSNKKKNFVIFWSNIVRLFSTFDLQTTYTLIEHMNTEAGHEEPPLLSSEELANKLCKNTFRYNSTNNFRVGIKWTKNQYLHSVKRD